jgi:hypothetical protein
LSCEDFLYTLKAGPAGGLRPPSGQAATRSLPGCRPTSHHRFYWGVNLLLVVTCEGHHHGVWPGQPKLAGERQVLLRLLDIPANTPVPGTVLVSDKGLAGRQVQSPWPASS